MAGVIEAQRGFTLEVRVDPPGDPVGNMAADERLAQEVRRDLSPPALRIYRWSRPAISLGRRQRLEDLPGEMIQKGLPLVRRPTGGGAVVHDPEEFTYALAMPLRMAPAGVALNQIPGFIHQRFRSGLVENGLVRAEEIQTFRQPLRGPCVVCFSTPVVGDLVYRGRKAAGAALRVWRDGFLMQGSIRDLPVAYPDLFKCFLEAVERSFGSAWFPKPLKSAG